MSTLNPLHGRGAAANPTNRFESTRYELDPDLPDAPVDEDGKAANRNLPLTQFIPDSTQSILTHNDSPDIPFRTSLNPYRGCEHGCIYCFARPTHEYLGMSAGLDFETKILVKHDAPELLRAALYSPRWQPEMICISSITDCYQPIERKLQITRRCLEVLAEFHNPVGIITKNSLVMRDLDILSGMASWQGVRVLISITTLDPHLTQIMEPRTSTPARRLEAIRRLTAAGVPVGVMVAPVVPGLTDHEMLPILEAARDAGARTAGFQVLRLPYAVKDLFVQWVEQHFPDRKNKILHRIESLRDDKLNSSDFHERMRGHGVFAEQFKEMFQKTTSRLGLNVPDGVAPICLERFRRPLQNGDQLPLFGG